LSDKKGASTAYLWELSLFAGNRIAFCLYLIAATIAIFPLFVVDVPPLVDYPNHIARMYVLATQGSQDIAQINYTVSWRPIPNLAMDLVVPPMVGALPVYDAGRLFLGLALLTVLGGICALHFAAFGRIGLTPIAGGLVLYNLPFAWGFVNFYASIGLSLLVLAGWLLTQRWAIFARLSVFNGLTSILYLSHLFGLAAYCCAVAFFEIGEVVRNRDLPLKIHAKRVFSAGCQVILPGALYLANGLLWAQEVEPLKLGSWFGDVTSKLSALFSGLSFYGGPADALPIFFASIVLLLSLRNRWVSVSPLLVWPLVGFLVLTLGAPHVFQGLFIDARLGVFLACIFVAALRFEMPFRPALTATAGVLLLIAFKSATIATIWLAHDKNYDDFRSAIAVVAPGARVLSVHDIPSNPVPSSEPRWQMGGIASGEGLSRYYADRGLITLAVIERGAFVPSLFTHPSAQPIQASAQNQRVDSVDPAPRLTVDMLVAGARKAERARPEGFASAFQKMPYWMNWHLNFDYVVIFRYGASQNPLPDLLEPVVHNVNFDVYRVRSSIDR
jgi:hypothetical protein